MGSSPSRGADVSVPSDLDSARGKLVYLYVALNDGATAEELGDHLDLSRGVVLSITGTLRDAGHLERTDDGFEIA
ncbi:helix-turn-helix domain-containing protein [Halosolutus halophilus]|uniref:helix-turn-helix domain-containing protein n=1 Tax=Halosolutus halophilus TaxID=1552990 RepID=UPI0022351605|nr:helix-turn-helix domain-containing protein [Halosolutus halophilus]